MSLPFKYCPMNVIINLVEFQLKQKLKVSTRSLRVRVIRHYAFYLCHVIAL